MNDAPSAVDAGPAVRWLMDAATRTGPDALARLMREAAGLIDATDVTIYLADYGQAELIPLVATGVRHDGEGGPAVPIDGTIQGRAYTTQQPQRPADRLCVPLHDGCDRLGVLEILTRDPTAPGLEAAAAEFALCLAQLLVSRRSYGDLVERVRRRLPMQLAAEIVWALLPPLSFATEDAVVTAILEPAYDIGGDVFDYALNGDTLHLGLFDTCGHGIDASMLAAVTVNAYRNARRTGLTLVDTARSIDKWIRSQHPGLFSTALLAELDCTTGVVQLINAGHPGPLLVRDGRTVRELPGPTALPLGIGHLSGRLPGMHIESLQPGDRLLGYTDGVTEAQSADGTRFGLDRLVDFVGRAVASELPTPETMRRLVGAIVEHQHEALQDDATALFMEWRPPRRGTRPAPPLMGP